MKSQTATTNLFHVSSSVKTIGFLGLGWDKLLPRTLVQVFLLLHPKLRTQAE